MRRALALLLALTLLGAAGLVYAHRVVGGTCDDVEVRETVLCGDSSAAQGIKAHVPLYAGGHLFWETELETASDSVPVTDFRYSRYGENLHGGNRKYYGLSVNLMTNMGASGNFGEDFEFDSDYYYGYYEEGYYMIYGDILRGVASRTAPGQEHEEYVELTDWIDYVPLQFDLDLPGFIYKYDNGEDYIESNIGSTAMLGAKLSEYFRLPLTGPCPMKVRISRDVTGEIVGWQLSSVDEYEDGMTDSAFTEAVPENVTTSNVASASASAAVSVGNWDGLNVGSRSVVTDDACYFVFEQWRPEDGSGRIDFSVLPGGRGVYRLPFEYEGGDRETTNVYLDDIEAVLPVEDGEYVELLDTDGERLLMFTEGNGRLYLTQAKLPGLTDVRKTELTELADSVEGWRDSYDRVVQSDGLYFLETIGGRVLLLESVGGGEYELVLNVPKDMPGEAGSVENMLWDREIRQSYDNNSTTLLWDGERFIMARWCGRAGYYGEASGFVLWVYDKTGLLYSGLYDSSLSCPPTEMYNNVVRASGDLGLAWK